MFVQSAIPCMVETPQCVRLLESTSCNSLTFTPTIMVGRNASKITPTRSACYFVVHVVRARILICDRNLLVLHFDVRVGIPTMIQPSVCALLPPRRIRVSRVGLNSLTFPQYLLFFFRKLSSQEWTHTQSAATDDDGPHTSLAGTPRRR